MTFLRRMAVLLAVMFWQGGFMFYGAVVVPVGSAVLESHLLQGFITRSVTGYLNWAGVAALVVWAWDLAAGRASRGRWGLWAVLVLMLACQFWLRGELNTFLDPESMRVHSRERFRELHSIYLILSTVQWAGAVALLGWTLRAWQKNSAEGNEWSSIMKRD